MATRRPPVTLRDFLELGCESSSDGFRSYPRCLPSTDDALHHHPPVRLCPSNGELDLLSLRRSPSSFSRSPSSLFSRNPSPSGGGPGAALATRISSLSRSFSRRIKEGFWRRRDEEDDDLSFVDDRDSCGFPSPLVSSCSASSSSDDEADDLALVDDNMACPPAAMSSSSSPEHGCTGDGAAADGNKMQADGDPAVGRSSKLGMEDKQQLSPVSVLDFPFDDDDADERSDAGTCSPSFHRCPPTPPDDLLDSRTTTKQAQLLHKIRRYDDGAVDPVDLEAQFTTTSDSGGESADASTHLATTASSSFTDTATSSSSATTSTTPPRHGEAELHHQSVEQPSTQDQDEYHLLARLFQEKDTAADEVSQVLLLDFFAEGIDRLRSSALDEKALLVRAAAEWVRGAGLGWGIRDVMLSGKAALEDMERGRRWMCVADEERDVGAAVEGLLMDELVDELLMELLVPYVASCWHADDHRR